MIPEELRRMTPLKGKERLGANRESEYLGAEDIEPGTEPVLTVDHLYNGPITLARGKERHDVITFREERVSGSINQVRPLVLNATNRKTLRKIYKSVTAENLEGKQIQLYLEHNVRDPSTGDKVDGIRIRPRIPEAKRTEPVKCAECGKVITAVGAYSAEDIARINMGRYGRALCAACSKKLSEPKEEAPKVTEQAETTEATKAESEET